MGLFSVFNGLQTYLVKFQLEMCITFSYIKFAMKYKSIKKLCNSMKFQKVTTT